MYKGKRFKCNTCGKIATSKFDDMMDCSKCRTKPVNNKKICAGCGRKFHTTTGKTLCRHCYSISGFSLTQKRKQKQLQQLPDCHPITGWEKSIKTLLVKLKWNLLSPVDLFRVAHIYMDCVCDENKYSTLIPEEQCQYMLLEMSGILKGELDANNKKSKPVVKIDANGNILAEYSSMKSAASANKVFISFVANSCKKDGYINAKGKNRKLRFRWKF
jgi:hypothetical protein